MNAIVNAIADKLNKHYYVVVSGKGVRLFERYIRDYHIATVNVHRNKAFVWLYQPGPVRVIDVADPDLIGKILVAVRDGCDNNSKIDTRCIG